MSIRSKRHSLVRALLPAVVAICLSGCSDPLKLNFIVPNRAVQGDADAQVTFWGEGFNSTTQLVIDGKPEALATGITTNYTRVVSSHELAASLNIAPDTFSGSHTIAVSSGRAISEPQYFSVQCPGCPPPPQLANVYPVDGGEVYRGETKTFRFLGKDFLDNSLTVQVSDSSLTIDPTATIVLHRMADTEYFDLPISVGSNASTGDDQVWVITAGGRSNPARIRIVSEQSPSFGPDSTPILNGVTPGHLGTGVEVLIKCEGSGFGTSRQVITEPPVQTTTYGVASGSADPDKVVVAKISPWARGPLRIRVQNNARNSVSDEFVLFVDDPPAGAPVAHGTTGDGIHRGGGFDLQIWGTNLNGVTDVSWGGIPGLIFSNTAHDSSYTTVHIEADATAPLTGDEATNLVVRTPAGESPPFLFRVFQ